MTAAPAIGACWGVVAVVWLAGAIYNASRGPKERTRARFIPGIVIAVVLVSVVIRAAPTPDWHALAVHARWVHALGFAILLVSTAFTLWARLALGTMWSASPIVKETHELRTHGPYAVTRHPIYTGLVGMLLGTSLLAGLGQWALLFPAGVVVAEIKIHMEERLMAATFPDAYPRYRREVPQLIPGLRRIHRGQP